MSAPALSASTEDSVISSQAAAIDDRRCLHIELPLIAIDEELALFFKEQERNARDERARDPIVEARRSYVASRIAALRSERAQLEGEEGLAAHPGLADTTQDLLEALKNRDLDRVRSLFPVLVSSPLWLEEVFSRLEQAFDRAKRPGLLFSLLIQAGPALNRIKLLALTAALGDKVGRKERALKLIVSLRNRKDIPAIRFGAADLLGRVSPTSLGKEVKAALSALKYRDISISSDEDIFDAAEKLSGRMDIDPRFLDHLFGYRQDKSSTRGEWEHQVRVAFCLDHLTADRPQPGPAKFSWVAAFNRLFDQDAKKQAYDSLDFANGILFAVFHGGLYSVAFETFKENFRNSVIFSASVGQPKQSSTKWIGIKDDPGAALMMALRAMGRGTALLMANDGRHGTRAHQAKVMDRFIWSANGAAFIAYESGCQTVWYVVLREGRRFIPTFVPGPKPDKGETFEKFSARWLSFYWRQVELLLTGSPSSMAVRRPWNKLALWDK